MNQAQCQFPGQLLSRNFTCACTRRGQYSLELGKPTVKESFRELSQHLGFLLFALKGDPTQSQKQLLLSNPLGSLLKLPARCRLSPSHIPLYVQLQQNPGQFLSLPRADGLAHILITLPQMFLWLRLINRHHLGGVWRHVLLLDGYLH